MVPSSFRSSFRVFGSHSTPYSTAIGDIYLGLSDETVERYSNGCFVGVRKGRKRDGKKGKWTRGKGQIYFCCVSRLKRSRRL
jgi:hypothetical protein